ncbi:MAG: alpha-amylase family glycosyl hydrolase, partial [candidate division WOR-3 bacterium]
FHILKEVRDRYNFDRSLYQLSGNVVFVDLVSVKSFTDKLNRQRREKKLPYLKPSQLNAMGLIDEILHLVIEKYQSEKKPDVFEMAIDELKKKLGAKEVEETLKTFINFFPPLPVYLENESAEEYLEKVVNKTITLKEMILVFLANENPAFNPFRELFDDTGLKEKTHYNAIIELLEEFFRKQPPFGPYNQTLIELLKSPMRASPFSLAGQLQYIKQHWHLLISPQFSDKLTERFLIALDFIREEEKERPGGPGPTLILEFTPDNAANLELHIDEERFTPDTKWMPNIVMIAKHTYVWLYQLSRKYQRQITRLDQIPDEELDLLSDWGFNALWLIGIWERSQASAKIKKLCGNPEAIASAYSIYDYVVASDLGGEAAFNNLKERAIKRNIRIAVDIVPNHTAIDSLWIKEHPEWFIQTDTLPFFNYKFNGPNLSDDPEIEIYIEDGYYTRTDAAVVFKLVDRKSGRIRYIYHGNDGTSTPWNDTAQLNFLIPEVREAVIKKIIEVARKSPIIRLDAAMTLTKRHYQRLWFPEPGKGGDIPSRTQWSMSRNEFNRLFPKEFWREVVERIARETPDTLLLAEAFWLMEGYFVRNLGMHRVYNSAFMNMLKMEHNREYHQVLKNILEFNPEILRRFVNFMSNPDELTAVDQFGKDDKYFGVCVLLATMPGLCMFAHGQIEGFKEKYGMEYRRSYWEEMPDEYLIKRHQKEIFPLLKKRYLFSGVENFLLYNFYDEQGRINDNVFAYSNRFGKERVLVVYNNRYQHTRGWINLSAPIRRGGSLIRKKLIEGLDLKEQKDLYYIFGDTQNRLQFLYASGELAEKGLYLELGAYKYRVFTEIKEVYDREKKEYSRLKRFLNGQGVKDIDYALKGMKILEAGLGLKEVILQQTLEKFGIQKDNIIKKKTLLLLTAIDLESLKNQVPEILEPVFIDILNNLPTSFKKDEESLVKTFQDKEVQEFLMVHEYEKKRWFNKERFEVMIAWFFLNFLLKNKGQIDEHTNEIKEGYFLANRLLEIAEEKEYRYDDFLDYLNYYLKF